MKSLNDYDIPFSGLKEGIHEYNFDVPPGFFEYFDNPEYTAGRLQVKIILDRKPQLLVLDFSITGYLRIVCDRCLEEFDCPVASNELIYIRIGDHYEELESNVIMIPREDNRINVAQFIYEFAILNVPLRKIHPEDKDGKSACNKDMLMKIREYGTEQKNGEDPRWDVLRRIL